MRSTIKDAIFEALKRLGGIAHRKEILDKILEDNLYSFRGKTPLESVSRELQENLNMFYSVYGKDERKGYWGLVEEDVNETDLFYTQDDEGFSEGRKYLRKHIVRERNPKLIKLAKEKFKTKHEGKLYCELCGFDFYDEYGELGKEYIEAHHIKPVSDLKEGEKTKVEDIIMVCSNCHSMLHRKRPWITSKEELKDTFKK